MGYRRCFRGKINGKVVENFKDKRVFFASIPHFPKCKHLVLLMTGERQERRIHLRRKGIKKCKTENRSPPLSRLKLSSRSPVYLIKQREEKEGDGGSLLRQKIIIKKGKTVALDLYSFGSFCD